MNGAARTKPYALLCSFAVVLSVLASYPVAEIGINDDWSYIRSANLMAQTGHVMYMGWASAMLGWILPLGAIFIKLFGFSFTVVRASGAFLAVLNAYLLQRCFVRSGLSERNAFFSALTILLCPIYLPLATTFMTDIPGMFVTLLCFYGCLRALQTPRDRSVFGWLVFACAISALGGTARQTAWLGVIVMVPSASWLLRKRRLPWVALGGIYVFSLFFIWASLRWFRHQPYSLGEALVGGYIDRDLLYTFALHIAQLVLELCLLVVPISLVFLPHLRLRQRAVRVGLGAAGLLLLLAAILIAVTHHADAWLAPFDGNYFTKDGLVDIVDLGKRAVMLSPWVRFLLTLLTLLGVVAVFGYSLAPEPAKAESVGLEREEGTVRAVPSLRELGVLLGPFTLVYAALLTHRALFERAYDRYLLAILFIPILFMVRVYQQRVGPRLPAAAGWLALAFGVFTIAANHDLFALQRARLRATQQLQSAGIPRDRFFAGWDYDGWTQVDDDGFVNSGWMNTPQGFTTKPPLPYTTKPTPCKYGWARVFPAIHPEYAISYSPTTCDGPSSFAPVEYRTWLPPFRSFFYIQRVVVKREPSTP